MEATVSFKAFITSLKHWKESTSTSPSGRHLGNNKFLLLNKKSAKEVETALENKHKNKPYTSIATSILTIYWQIMTMTISLGQPLSRWQRSLTTMIQKVPGNSQIDKLRVTHLFEADYNLWLKIMWGRRLVKHSNSLSI
jgi:hypothetical protein